MRLFAMLFFPILFTTNVGAQLNDYKYIVIPVTFDGFKKQNQYQTSTLIKYLFVQKGFPSVYSDALPDDLRINPCLGLTVQLNDRSTMFTTKSVLTLLDCDKKEVFTSKEGKSKQKNYQRAYEEAIRESFSSFDALVYGYRKTNAADETVSLSFKGDVKELDDTTAKNPTATQRRKSMIAQEATRERQLFKDRRPTEQGGNYIKTTPTLPRNVQPTATGEEQRYEDRTPAPSSVIKKAPAAISSDKERIASQVLYAQKLPNGYQLVDHEPRIVLKIFETDISDVFIAEGTGENGVVYKKEGQWYHEYYDDGKRNVRELALKF